MEDNTASVTLSSFRSPEEALADLKRYDKIYKFEAMEYALQNKEAITPLLLELLDDIENNPIKYVEMPNFWGHIYAVYLVMQFREARAHRSLINIFSLPETLINDLYGDFITQDLPASLYHTRGDSFDAIVELIENKDAYEFCRASAIEALTFGVYDGVLDRDEIIQYLSKLFTGNEAEEYSYFWQAVAYGLMNLGAVECLNILEDACKRGLFDYYSLTLDEIRDEISAERDWRENFHHDVERFYPKNLHTTIASWAAFTEPDEEDAIPDFLDLEDEDDDYFDNVIDEKFEYSNPQSNLAKQQKKRKEKSRKKNKAAKKARRASKKRK